MSDKNNLYIALSGGVGGAKLVLGMYSILDSECLKIIANTADDFEHLGFYISPDIDTLLYTLSGLNDKEKGWGRADESWNFMEGCKCLGMETWFRLGDKDLAIHVFRRQAFEQGYTLSEITQKLCELLGIKSTIIPMTDDFVSTVIDTNYGKLSFQDYFVKHSCVPEIKNIEFLNIDKANISPGFDKILASSNLNAIIICPSNPFLSIKPILSIRAVKKRLKESCVPVIVVSPIIGGKSLKGPTTKIMKEMSYECDIRTIANIYADIADAIIIDNRDSKYIKDIEKIGLKTFATDIKMITLQDRIRLAEKVILFSKQLHAI